MRASGWFTVEGQDQYFVDVEAGIETVETREHIVMGLIRPTRFLLLGRWPKSDTGWWYIFFTPSTIQEIHPGHLTFGARSRQALRIVYAPDADTVQTLYLAFDDPVALRRVWDDLMLDMGEIATNCTNWTKGRLAVASSQMSVVRRRGTEEGKRCRKEK